LLNRDRVTGKDIENNEKCCDTFDVKEDLYCEEELMTVQKRIKNNKVLDTNSLLNGFFKYGCCEFRYML